MNENKKMTLSIISEDGSIDEVEVVIAFEFKDTKMVNRQEEPKNKREFELGHKTTEKKLWCVLGEDEKFGEYWTIMYPSEY